MRLRTAAIALLCLTAAAGEARSQVVWDSPLLLSPRPVAGTGIYLIDAHGAGLGVLGTWRGAPYDLGFRAGIADGAGGIAILGGIDKVGPLATASATFPLDISWLAGVGLGYNNWLVISAPLGLTMGRTFDVPEVRFTPYLAPALVVDAVVGRPEPAERNQLRLGLAVDLGLDVAFQPGWLIRFGAGLGNRHGLAIGIVF
jgi:hypothetical protein